MSRVVKDRFGRSIQSLCVRNDEPFLPYIEPNRMHSLGTAVGDTIVTAHKSQRWNILRGLGRDLKKIGRLVRDAGIVHVYKAGMLALRSRLMRRSEGQWERTLGISFADNVALEDLDIESKNKPLGFSYVPSLGRPFRAMLDSIPDALSQFSFVDFGSGEGRVLLMAAEYPFREIIGVEFAQELHDAAVHNIHQATSGQEPSDVRIQSFHMDAVQFELPRQDCVLHFNNPFGEQIFAKVLANIERLHRESGKKVYILYQQVRNDLESAEFRSANISILRAASFLRERPIRFATMWDRFLLGSHELYLFESRAEEPRPRIAALQSGFLATVVRKLRKSIAQRGVTRTAGRCAAFPIKCAYRVVRSWTPSWRRKVREGIEFDRRFNVDTCPELDANWIARIESENWQYGAGYDPAPIASLTENLQRLSIRFEDFTFVDLGSGKGRSLFLAAQFPFAEILGVEFCPRLHAIAERNIKTYRNPEQKCGKLQSVYGDAAEFTVPDGPIVYFLNQPFDEPVMRKVVDRIVESYRQHPRKIIVVYYDPTFFPKCEDLFRNGPFHERLRNGREFVIYETE